MVPECYHDLTEEPACIAEAWIVKVEDKHVGIKDLIEHRDYNLDTCQNRVNVLDRIVFIPRAVLVYTPIGVVYYARVKPRHVDNFEDKKWLDGLLQWQFTRLIIIDLHLGRVLGRSSRIYSRLASFISLKFQAELAMINDRLDGEH